MKQSMFSCSGEVSPALVCLVIVGIAILYGTMFFLGRLADKRRHDQAMTSEELQARIAKDVTADDIDRLLPTSLRKSSTFARTPVDYDAEDHSDKVNSVCHLMGQARDFELSMDERHAYLAQSSLLLNSIRTTDRVAFAWIVLTRKQIDTLADELGLTTERSGEPRKQSEADLDALIASSQNVVMSPAEQEAQRRSFAYGNVSLANPSVTREMVDAAAKSFDHTSIDVIRTNDEQP